MRLLLLVILACFLFIGCKGKADLLTDKTYTTEKIGWTINLPGEKWKVMTEKEMKKLNAKGNKIIEDATNVKIDNSTVEQLINLKKDPFNYFVASIEPFDSVTFGNYDDLLTATHNVMKESFKSLNILAEYELGATRIDGLMMDRFIIKLSSKPSGSKTFYEEMYTCLINNYVFGIILVYNNEKDKETLRNILNSSNFSMNSDL